VAAQVRKLDHAELRGEGDDKQYHNGDCGDYRNNASSIKQVFTCPCLLS